jgi:hypothetical protein
MMKNSALFSQSMVDQQVLRWPTPTSRLWTISLVESAFHDKNIIAVVATGSAVRPNIISKDLDLIVICRDSSALTLKPPIEIDLRIYEEKTIEDALKNGHDLLNWTIRFGKSLFDTEEYWHRLVHSWKSRLPFPSAVSARQRAASAARHLSNTISFGDLNATHEQAVSYLTHIARAELLEKGVYPKSRPELPNQLRNIGSWKLGASLERLLTADSTNITEIETLVAQVA